MRAYRTHRGATLAAMLISVWLAYAPAVALGQSSAASPAKTVSALGYGFGGIGAAACCGESAGTLHFGGGGEAVIGDAVGVGAEIGYLMPFESAADGVGVLSVNGTYHLYPHQPTRKARPFVTGGYTLGFRDGHANLWNFGGGVDYWLKPKFGLRVEFRDHVWSEGGDTTQFLGVRFGIVFR